MGYAASHDAITMTAPASRQCVAMECFKQWSFLFSIGSPACSLDVPVTLSAWYGENLSGISKKIFEHAVSEILLFACLHICVYVLNHSNVVRSKHATMKTVAIISQKGGAGKTTVAIHLAVAAEQRGVRTAVFDLDPQASATSWADRRKHPIPAVVAAQPPRLVNLLEQAAAQSAELVLIDSAPNADAASLAAARVADLILIPCRPAAFDLDAIGTT